ncbi:MAG: serine hydrolase [bacterium]|nr:serine hydrolase [bacterium]
MRKQRRVHIAAILTAATLIGPIALHSSAAEAADGDWERWGSPEEAGFSSAAIAAAEQHWQGLPDAPIGAFVMVFKGKILASFGRETSPFWCHSMRKSFLSALYGIHVANGNIDLDMTLEELDIDDSTALTPAEKQAKVRHLIKARSGIYIEAACEAPEMKAARPPRGSHPPDTFWYYNNWDFNALGTIFRQETGVDIFEEFQNRIGRHIGMQDFTPVTCHYAYEPFSEHPCYTFRMTTRDRARFGQLFLQNGRWGDRQIIPEEWVAESTRAYSQSEAVGRGYGYMWWTYEPEFFQLFLHDPRLRPLWGYAASGYGGQAILVLPDAEIVAACGVDVPAGGDLDILETAPLLEIILTGREIIDLRTLRAKAKPRRVAPGETLRLVAKLKNASPDRSLATSVDFYLAPEKTLDQSAWWLGKAKVNGLAAGKKKGARLKAAVPEDVPPGTYYLVTVADQDKSNYDLDRENNLKVGKKVVVK